MLLICVINLAWAVLRIFIGLRLAPCDKLVQNCYAVWKPDCSCKSDKSLLQLVVSGNPQFASSAVTWGYYHSSFSHDSTKYLQIKALCLGLPKHRRSTNLKQHLYARSCFSFSLESMSQMLNRELSGISEAFTWFCTARIDQNLGLQ